MARKLNSQRGYDVLFRLGLSHMPHPYLIYISLGGTRGAGKFSFDVWKSTQSVNDNSAKKGQEARKAARRGDREAKASSG